MLRDAHEKCIEMLNQDKLLHFLMREREIPTSSDPEVVLAQTATILKKLVGHLA
jgi:hypothetical protein